MRNKTPDIAQQTKSRLVKTVVVKVFSIEAAARASTVWFRQVDPKPYIFEVTVREQPQALRWKVDSMTAPDDVWSFARGGETMSLRRAILGELPGVLMQELLKSGRIVTITRDQIDMGKQVVTDSVLKAGEIPLWQRREAVDSNLVHFRKQGKG